MKAIMVLACLVWGAFVVLHYRGVATRYLRHKNYAEYAAAVFSSVSEHFEELKTKNRTLVKDLGFNKFDDSAWREEVERFIGMIVLPKISQSARGKIRNLPDSNREFSTLTYNFVLDLMCYTSMPASYDLQQLIDSIERKDETMSLISGVPLYHRGKDLAIRFAAAVVLLIGGFAQMQPSYASQGQPFSPLDACNALADEAGFTPNKSGYSELYDGIFTCATPYKDTQGGVLPNNLAMYGKGGPDQVTRLKLMLNVNVKANAARDTKELGRLCQRMIETLTGTTPAGFATKVATGAPFSMTHDGYRVYLEKDVWPTGKGYELNCAIATPGHKE